jgi:hypothetical protein
MKPTTLVDVATQHELVEALYAMANAGARIECIIKTGRGIRYAVSAMRPVDGMNMALPVLAWETSWHTPVQAALEWLKKERCWQAYGNVRVWGIRKPQA